MQLCYATDLGGEIVGAAAEIGEPEIERVGLPDDGGQSLTDRSIRTNRAKASRVIAGMCSLSDP